MAGRDRMYSGGDYRFISRRLEPAAWHLVELAGVGAGAAVLDAACGDGNVAAAAARAGAGRIVACDVAAEQLDLARRRFAGEGVAAELVEGDVQALPFGDAQFDAVLSTFGVIYARDVGGALAELARVTRQGGVVGLTLWPPGSFNEEMNQVVAAVLELGPETLPDLAAAGLTDVRAVDGEVLFSGADEHALWDEAVAHAPPLHALRAAAGEAALAEVGRAYRAAALRHGRRGPGGLTVHARYRALLGTR